MVTMAGTLGGVLVSSLVAYPLSRKRFKLRGLLSFYVFFTMLFSGGLIPTYIVVSNLLGLRNNFLALILPILVNPWYILILRTYFSQIPEELIDAARVDGAGEWRIFFKIVLPLSKPALATIGLFYVLAYWNDWFQALLYIDNSNLYPLQYLLYSILTNIQALAENPFFASELAIVPAQTVRMAMAVLVAGPAVFAFLLVQKYFIRGLTIGSLKG
jgi:putative aldouronate transport system permease protein